MSIVEIALTNALDGARFNRSMARRALANYREIVRQTEEELALHESNVNGLEQELLRQGFEIPSESQQAASDLH